MAGQNIDYLIDQMLRVFRDRSGRRSNPWMTAVALRLDDVQMEAVASYIANMD